MEGKGRECVGVLLLFKHLLKRGKKEKIEGTQFSKGAPCACESPGCCFSADTGDQEQNNCLYVLDVLCSAKQETEPSGHLSPREERNKNPTVVGSASFSILLQTPCCTSKCHYGLCYTAAGKRM